MPINNDVIVLGDAPEAALVSRELFDLGYQVHRLAQEAPPSGQQPLAYQGYPLARLDGHVGGFQAHVQGDGSDTVVNAAAIVIANGNERYYPAERYRLALSSHVLTTSQVRAQLTAPTTLSASLAFRRQRFLLMLDLGGRTGKEMTSETLRLALQLRERWHSEVYVFYQNLQVDTYNLEALTREMRDKGVVFCRYADPQIALDDDGVAVTYVEGVLRGETLVLPEAVRPKAENADLATLLRVRLGEDGFFQELNVRQYRPGLTVRKGIFVAGRCHMDGDEDDARADALQAVANVDALLGAGELAPEEIIAHVDSTKCIRCLTCVRTCPHAAVEIAEQADVVAARVVDLACWGCGACAANCPVRAIEMVGQAVPAWMQ